MALFGVQARGRTKKLVQPGCGPVGRLASPFVAEVGGVNIQAGVRRARTLRIARLWSDFAAMGQGQQLPTDCPPIARERVTELCDGCVVYAFRKPWRDGTRCPPLTSAQARKLASPASSRGQDSQMTMGESPRFAVVSMRICWFPAAPGGAVTNRAGSRVRALCRQIVPRGDRDGGCGDKADHPRRTTPARGTGERDGGAGSAWTARVCVSVRANEETLRDFA